MGWPGEQLIIKLWETLTEKGIGSLLKPWQMEREGMVQIKLHRAATLVMAQTARDADEIRIEQKRVEDFSSEIRFADRTPASIRDTERIEPTIDIAAILRVAERQTIQDSIRRQVNVAKAIVHAEEDLLDDPQEPPDRKIDGDWLYRWRDYAGDISAEEMQSLWGRVLAGELKDPGSYSLRCLDFLRNLSREEAKTIANLSRFTIGGFIWRGGLDLLQSEGINFTTLMEVQELGIITSVEAHESIGLTQTKTINPRDLVGYFPGFTGLIKSRGKVLDATHAKVLDATNAKMLVATHGKVLVATNDDSTKLISLPVYALTSLGRQVISLCRFQPHIEYCRKLGEALQAQGFVVELCEYVSGPGSTMNLFNKVPIGNLKTVPKPAEPPTSGESGI